MRGWAGAEAAAGDSFEAGFGIAPAVAIAIGAGLAAGAGCDGAEATSVCGAATWVCQSQYSVGSVPRTKYSVYTMDWLVTKPSSSTTSSPSQSPVASFP